LTGLQHCGLIIRFDLDYGISLIGIEKVSARGCQENHRDQSECR
jgi:hypothetical protein